jgi:hypothetical protein
MNLWVGMVPPRLNQQLVGLLKDDFQWNDMSLMMEVKNKTNSSLLSYVDLLWKLYIWSRSRNTCFPLEWPRKVDIQIDYNFYVM